jgi:hypothetical protein
LPEEIILKLSWIHGATRFIQSMSESQSDGFRSVPNGPRTLYGTCYALLARFYLGSDEPLPGRTKKFILECQDPESGLLVGPELRGFSAMEDVLHTREHLLLHLTCTVLPVCRQFRVKLPSSVRVAHTFCELNYLLDWLDRRNFKNAWFEGNNILFVGQLLVYLRDEEGHPDAPAALDRWFEWLDRHIDPATSLWGTNGCCSAKEAVYGGYHQLLVYYHENHPIRNPQGLVDTVLELQHPDGGFNPHGNGGACEDVDSVDILVNLYKRSNYRRPEIRCALRQCLRHILALQNPDGGFPYNRDRPQSHMGIPGTAASPNQSTMFATWFRVHTLALMAEILTDEPELQFPFRFTNNLSMGWHQTWGKAEHPITTRDREEEGEFEWLWRQRRTFFFVKRQSHAFARAIYRTRNAAGRLRRSVLGK